MSVGDDAGVQDGVPCRDNAGAAVPLVHLVVFVQEFRRAADDVIGLEAEHPGERRITHADAAVRVDQNHGVGHVAEHGFQQGLLRMQFLRRADLVGCVAEADDAADDGVAQVLRARIAFDDPPILQLQGGMEFLVRFGVDAFHIGKKHVGFFGEAGDPVAHLPAVPRGEQVVGQGEHLDETLVECLKPTVQSRDHDAVGGRVQGCLEQRDIGPQRRFGGVFTSDVAPDAAIAEELTARPEHRLAADRDVAHVGAGGADVIAEVLKRAMRRQVVQVVLPLLRVDVLGRNVGAPLAEDGGHVEPQHLAVAVREVGKPQVRIHFPEPVRGDLGDVAEPLFAMAERFRRLVTVGHVGGDGDHAAVGQGRAADFDDPSGAQSDFGIGPLALADQVQHVFGDLVRGARAVVPAPGEEAEHIGHGHADLDEALGKFVDIVKDAVSGADHQVGANDDHPLVQMVQTGEQGHIGCIHGTRRFFIPSHHPNSSPSGIV